LTRDEEELDMNWASLVTDTTQRRLSCTTALVRSFIKMII